MFEEPSDDFQLSKGHSQEGKKDGVTCLFKRGEPWLLQEWTAGKLADQSIVAHSKDGAWQTVDDEKQLAGATKKLSSVEAELKATEADVRKDLRSWFEEEKKKVKEADANAAKAALGKATRSASATRATARDLKNAAKARDAAVAEHNRELYDFALDSLEASIADKRGKAPQNGGGEKTDETRSQRKLGKSKALLEEIGKAIAEYHGTEFVGTAVQVGEKRAIALDKLTKKFEGREVYVALPIKNVTGFAGSMCQVIYRNATTTIVLFRWQGGSYLRVLEPTIKARNQETGKLIEVMPLENQLRLPSFAIFVGGVDLPVACEVRSLAVAVAREDARKNRR